MTLSGTTVVINPAKLVVVLAMVASASVLLALGRISPEAYFALVGPFTGLAIGNGINAKRGDNPAPLIAPAPRFDRRSDDLAPPALPAAPTLPPRDPFADEE